MKLPLILTNFKTYESATGKKALELAKIHANVATKTGKNITVAVQAFDLANIAQNTNLPVFAQNIDAVTYGSFTGWNLAEGAKSAGAVGTILNHSEHRLEFNVLEKSIKRAKEVGLYTVVCAETAREGAEIMQKFAPDLIAVEPPELIGGDISVSTANPEIISESVQLIGPGKVLVGAGIKNGEDVRIAIKLGAVGVLLASGITKVENPEEVLFDLAHGL